MSENTEILTVRATGRLLLVRRSTGLLAMPGGFLDIDGEKHRPVHRELSEDRSYSRLDETEASGVSTTS